MPKDQDTTQGCPAIKDVSLSKRVKGERACKVPVRLTAVDYFAFDLDIGPTRLNPVRMEHV